jgi:polysaccharide export outer membrane protein
MLFRSCTITLSFIAIACVGLFGQSKTSSASQQQSVAPPTQSNPVNAPVLQSRDQRYRLERSDVFDLDFGFTPEYNETATIQPDGYISLRGVGDVKVLGQTIPEASETIRAAYSGVLKNAQVAIILKDFEKPYFIAGGWIEKPGRYDLRGDTTLSQAIQVAGGLKDGAKTSQVILFRSVSSDLVEVKKLNLKDILTGKDSREDVHLRPGDMFLVPKSTFASIAPYLPRTMLGTYFNPASF